MAKTSFKKPGPPAAAGGTKPTPTAPPKKAPAAAPAPKPAATPPKKPAAAPPPGVRTNAAPPKKVVAAAPEVEEAPVEELPLEENAGEEQVSGDELAIREPEDGTLAVPSMMSAPLGQPVGQFDPSDFDTPFLKLMQSTSPLVENNPGVYNVGDWVVQQGDAGTIIWQDGWEPLEVTILRYGKGFMEQLKYGEDERPRVFATAEAAQAAGLIPFGGDGVGYVSYADTMVLVKAPPYELELPDFTEEFDGERYALCMWRITGTAYKFAAKKIMGLLRTDLKGGLHLGAISLEARLEKGKIRSYFVPQLRKGEIKMHSQEFLDFAAELAG